MARNHLLLFAICTLGAQAQAAAVIYRDGTDFRAAFPGMTFESFEDEAMGSGPSLSTTYFSVANTSLGSGTASVNISDTPDWANIGVQFLGAGSATGDAFRATFTLAFPVNAVGFYVLDASEQEGLANGHRFPSVVAFELPNGESFEISTCPPCNPGTQYFGLYYSDYAFSSFSILNTADEDAIGFDGMSMLPAPVPVPAAVWLLGSALAALSVIRRRSTVERLWAQQ